MTVSASYFDNVYAASPDPWGFTSRWYEARKYAITMAMLPKPHYRDGSNPAAPSACCQISWRPAAGACCAAISPRPR